MLKYKIVLAGAKNVGKSSLIARFCDNVFNEEMMDTIGVAFKRKKMIVDENRELDLTIWDFGGEEKYRFMFPSYVNGAAAALILFDSTRKETLEDVKNWVEIIDENTNKNIVKILLATKIDLEKERQVSIEDARKLCKKYNCYKEPLGTSSKTGENVEKAFQKAAEGIMNERLQRCTKCGEIFAKKLKICNFCGANAELKAVQM
jgi:small GTP-binding protein